MPMHVKSPAPVRVVVLETSPIVQEGLAKCLARARDLKICARVTAAAGVRPALARTRAGVLLMELMPDGHDGVSIIKELVTEHPRLRILVYSGHDENVYAERVLRAGALGYAAKTLPAAELIVALRTVASGGLYVSPRLSLILLGRLLRPAMKQTGRGGVAGLTNRELHVFQLLGAGLLARDIGRRLGVSAKTVQAHRENIKNKLGLANSRELLRYAALWLSQHAGETRVPKPNA